MLTTAAATAGVQYVFSHREKKSPLAKHSTLQTYCCYFVCAAHERSVSDS